MSLYFIKGTIEQVSAVKVSKDNEKEVHNFIESRYPYADIHFSKSGVYATEREYPKVTEINEYGDIVVREDNFPFPQDFTNRCICSAKVGEWLVVEHGKVIHTLSEEEMKENYEI